MGAIVSWNCCFSRHVLNFFENNKSGSGRFQLHAPSSKYSCKYCNLCHKSGFMYKENCQLIFWNVLFWYFVEFKDNYVSAFRLYNNHNQDINTAFKCHHVVFDTDATQRYKQYTPGLCFKLILFYARSWYSIYPRTFYITGILTSMWELIFFFILIWNEEITNAGIPFEEIIRKCGHNEMEILL